MKISICIPTYNRSEWLQKAIASAQKQDYENIEIIISDNASTDDTENVCNTFVLDDSRIIYHRNDENIGSLLNFKRCLYEYVTGDYMIFLSDDDELIDPSYISNAVKLLEKYQNLSIIFSNARLYYNEIGQYTDEKKKLPPIINGKDFFINYGLGDYSLCFCNVIFHTQQARDTDCFEGSVFYADSDCFFRLMMLGDVGYIDTLGSLYRIHANNSYKTANIQKFFDNENYITRNYHYVLKYLEKERIEKREKRQILGYYTTVLSNLIIFGDTSDIVNNIRGFKEKLKLIYPDIYIEVASATTIAKLILFHVINKNTTIFSFFFKIKKYLSG